MALECLCDVWGCLAGFECLIRVEPLTSTQLGNVLVEAALKTIGHIQISYQFVLVLSVSSPLLSVSSV